MELTDKVAIVTGSGRGIGKGIAKILAKDGAKIIVADMNLDDALKVASEIDDLGSSGTPLRVDVTVQEAVDSMVDSVISKFGQIDILVNNAGINRPEPFSKVSEGNFEEVMGLNVKSAFFVAQIVVKGMIHKGKGGSVINMSSQMGHVGGQGRSVYCAARFRETSGRFQG